MSTKELAEEILSLVRNYFEISDYAVRLNYNACLEHIEETIKEDNPVNALLDEITRLNIENSKLETNLKKWKIKAEKKK